jgi:hypothetical protein
MHLLVLQEAAADVLVRFVDRLPVPFIVRQLQPERPLLLWYLHTLFRRMPDQYNAPEYEKYHVLQVSRAEWPSIKACGISW